MSETGETLAFWINRDYDTDRASDGVTRYGSYVRAAFAGDREPWERFDGPADAKADFAATAWRAATGPVMAPGYVRYHPLVTGARMARSGWDGSLTGHVTLATPPPAGIAKLHHWRDWESEHWRDEKTGSDYHRPTAPHEQQLAELPKTLYFTGYALTTVELAFPMPMAAASLPDLPAGPDAPELVEAAKATIDVLVGELNTLVAPVIDAL